MDKTEKHKMDYTMTARAALSKAHSDFQSGVITWDKLGELQLFIANNAAKFKSSFNW